MRNNFLIESTKEESTVFYDRTANRKATELIISPWNRSEGVTIGIRGKVGATLLEVGHGIHDRIVFVFVNAAVPTISSRFCDDIHNRAGVASIFRAKLIGDQNILLNKFAVSHEKSRAAHAIVVVVLAIDLLVIVATAKAVYRKALSAVGI